VKGRIKERSDDVTEFNGSLNKRLISGQFVDEHGKYAEGVEIIVVLAKNPLQRVVKAFVKTNNNGSFSFILDDFGPYKVIIRSPKRNAKIIENFRIQSNSGFFTSISLENLNFNKDGDWIWISN
jgi:hypothetical protein